MKNKLIEYRKVSREVTCYLIMTDINYNREYLNTLSILELRLIAQKYTNNIPINREDIIKLVLHEKNNFIMSDSAMPDRYDDIITSIERAKPLPDRWNLSIYKEELYFDNYSEVLLEYYMFNDGREISPVLTLYSTFDQRDKLDILGRLGLDKFKSTEDDLISLLNIIPGIGWNPDKARKITSISKKDVLSISKLNYFNSILAYSSGYYLNYDIEDKNKQFYKDLTLKPIKYVILSYLSIIALPDIVDSNYKIRPIDNMYISISKKKIPAILSGYIDMVVENGILKTVDIIGMVPPSNISKLEYLLNSLLEYQDVKYLETKDSIPRDKNLKVENYSDKVLLEIIEEPVKYRYRYELELSAKKLLQEYRWSLYRSRYCKNTKSTGPILTYGRALDYYCFDFNDISNMWTEDNVLKNGGFLRPGYKEGEPHKYLTTYDIHKLLIFLENNPAKIKYRKIIDSLSRLETYPYKVRGKTGTCKILIICYDNAVRNRINSKVYDILKRNFKVNFDKCEIEYISSSLMYLDDVYHTIKPFSFPDKKSLDILSKHRFKYDYIVYEYCPLGSNKMPMKSLIDYSVLNVLNDNLKDEGFLLMTDSRSKNTNRISEVFDLVDKVDIRDNLYDRKIYIYSHKISKPKIDIEPPSPIKPNLPPYNEESSKPESKSPDPITYNNPLERYLGIDWRFNWNIVKNSGGGDCLYCVIVDAISSNGEVYTIKDLRDFVAQSVSSDNLEDWKTEVISDKVARVTLEPEDISRGMNFNDKRIQMAKIYNEQNYTIEDIREYIRKNRYGTIDDIKLLSNILNFIPIIIPNNFQYMPEICNAISDYNSVIYGNALFNKDIILIKLDPGAPHYELIEEKRTGRKLFGYDEIPKDLIDAFLQSCNQLKEIYGKKEIQPWDGREILKDTTDFKLTGDSFARGAFNTVSSACVEDDCNYVYTSKFINSIDEFWEYMRMLKSLSDNKIGPILYDYIWDKTGAVIISEKLDKTLDTWLNEKVNTTELKQWYRIDVGEASIVAIVEYSMVANFPKEYNAIMKIIDKMHRLGYMHDDLHSHNANIMFNGQGEPRLIDFDTAKRIDDIIPEKNNINEYSMMKREFSKTYSIAPEITTPFDVSPYRVTPPVNTEYQVYMYRCESAMLTYNLISYLKSHTDMKFGDIQLVYGHICVWMVDPRTSKIIFIGTTGNDDHSYNVFDKKYMFLKTHDPRIHIEDLKPIYEPIVQNQKYSNIF